MFSIGLSAELMQRFDWNKVAPVETISVPTFFATNEARISECKDKGAKMV